MAAVVQDDGSIVNLRIIFPVAIESAVGEAQCVTWQEALDQTIRRIRSVAEKSQYRNCTWVIRNMELTQIANDRGITHPIWNIDVEQTRGYFDSDKVENYITTYHVDAANGEILWPQER